MADRIRIDMACNDPDSGAFTGRVSMIHLPGGMLELTAKQWNITSFRRCPKFDENDRRIVLSSKAWPIASVKAWYGNWCWNAYWFEAKLAVEFLIWLHARAKFHSEGGWTNFCAIWDSPPPLKLDVGWQTHLVEESRRG